MRAACWLALVLSQSCLAYRVCNFPAHRTHARTASPLMMPIGMPKVAYRVPGSSVADWVGIYDRLYRERIMFIGQEIDDDLINKIVAVMLYSDAEDSQKPMYLYLNSPGGSIVSGLTLYDTMQHIASPIATVNIGLSASMASFILGAGERGKRIALPHSRVMIHQPMGGARGQAEDIRIEAEQILQMKSSLVDMYAQMTGQTRERILKDLDRDTFMSAEQALEYGLIDKIVSSVNDSPDVVREMYKGGIG